MSSPQIETASGVQTAARTVGPALPPLRNVAQVAAGGAIGAALRYAFILLFPTDPGRFPLTILAENVIGAFLLGFVLTVLLVLPGRRWDARPFLTTGILGSFTTFSNISLDLFRLGADGHSATAAAYALASVVLGIAAAAAGVLAGRWIVGRRR